MSACLIYTIASVFLVVSFTGIPICSYILNDYLNLRTYERTNCTGASEYSHNSDILGYYYCSVKSYSNTYSSQTIILNEPAFNYHFEHRSLSDCNSWYDSIVNSTSFTCFLSTQKSSGGQPTEIVDGYTNLNTITGWAIGLSIGCLLLIISILLFVYQCTKTRTHNTLY